MGTAVGKPAPVGVLPWQRCVQPSSMFFCAGHPGWFAVPCAVLCAALANLHAQPPRQTKPATSQAVTAASQSPLTTIDRADLPPSSVYEQVLAPFDQVRADMANWSEAEIVAYQATSDAAKQECSRLERAPHEGDEELALARLCTLGHEWDGAFSAARWYTRRNAPPQDQAHLPTGFALMLQADLNLQHVPSLIEHLAEMNERLPLSAETSAIFRFTVNALEVTQLTAAMQAAWMQQPGLLRAIGEPDATKAGLPQGQAEADAWHTLALLRQSGNPQGEQAQKAKLVEAIAHRGAPLPPAEAYLAQHGHAAYVWLGKPLPQTTSRVRTARTAHMDDLPGGAGLLVIQREDAADVPALLTGVDGLRKRLERGLSANLILIRTAAAAPQTAPAAARRSTPQTHAVFTTDNLLSALGAASGPLFVLTDADGQIAYLGTGNAAWLNPSAHADSLLERVSANAVPPASPSAPPH